MTDLLTLATDLARASRRLLDAQGYQTPGDFKRLDVATKAVEEALKGEAKWP